MPLEEAADRAACAYMLDRVRRNAPGTRFLSARQDVACFRARKKAIQDLLKTKRRPEYFINYCFIVRNGIKRNRYFNEINPLVADISRVV
jgi:hypothetical protein